MGSLKHVPAKQKIPLIAMLALSLAWMVGAILALAIPCSSDDPSVDSKEVCMGTVSGMLFPRVRFLLTRFL